MSQGQPEPGYYVIRRKRIGEGEFLPARIWRPCTCSVHGGGDDAIDPNALHEWQDDCDRYPRLAAEIDGKPSDVEKLWNTILIHLHEGPIDETMVSNSTGRWAMKVNARDYEFICKDLAWCRKYAPDQAIKKLTEYYRIETMKPIF